MSRATVFYNVLLVVLVIAQAWTIHTLIRQGRMPPDRDERAGAAAGAAASPVAAGTPPRSGPTPRRAGSGAPRVLIDPVATSARSDGDPSPRAENPAPMSSDEADRRLRGLLPGREIGRAQLRQFQARLATLPPVEQYALSTALMRAINEDRMRIRP